MQAYPLNRNVILDHLSPSDLALLQPDLTSVELGVRRRLADADVPIGHVYFLESVRPEPPIEIGVIRREGVVNSRC